VPLKRQQRLSNAHKTPSKCSAKASQTWNKQKDNTNMPTTLSKIVDGFPHQTIPSMVGIFTYDALNDLQLALNANAASVWSNLDNGLLGLLALTVSIEVHNTLAGEPFVLPINPGPAATIPGALTGAQIANLHQDHNKLKALFVKYYATNKALKQQTIGAINKLYLPTLIIVSQVLPTSPPDKC
jgi:hypothetical protein